jgi:glycosyltransferase involved in cell wall biosynthesis
MSSSLYICYFGLREPLVQTQVLPYLRELVSGGIDVSLLTFEPDEKSKWTPDQIDVERKKLAGGGIDWHHLAYHKSPSAPATLYDVMQGVRFIRRFIAEQEPDILHGRVHLPTLMAVLARKFSRRKPKVLFDIRGFFPEEYVDAGVWPENGLLYRAAKSVERWLMKEADGFVVLTEKARSILFPESAGTGRDKLARPVEVIPCCVDLERFRTADERSREKVRSDLGIGERFTAVYVGAFGGWYLTKETADFFGELKRERPNSFAMILTQSGREMIEPLLRERGYGDADLFIDRVSPADLPGYLSGADVAISFIKSCYSKQASSPTKNAEYLASGLPIIANDGVGDTTEQIRQDRTGVVIDEFTESSYSTALTELDVLTTDREALAEHCRASSRNRFDLETVGGARYRQLYRSLLDDRDK